MKTKMIATVLALGLLLTCVPFAHAGCPEPEAVTLTNAASAVSKTPENPDEPEGPEEAQPVQHPRYINGASDGLFRPGSALSRAELAKIIFDLGDYPEGEAAFNDVEEGRYFTAPVNALAAAGILNGYSDGSFQPARPVTRAEFVTILMRLSGKHAEGTNDFPDVPEGRFFTEAVAVAQENGWVNGYNDGTFRPDNPVTRAEAVTMVNRYLGRKADRAAVDAHPEYRFFPDVAKGTWYYYEVMEASIEHTALYQEDGSEQWEDATPYALNLADGLYCLNWELYLVRDRQFVVAEESSTIDGINYTCTGETGICTAEGETLITADNRLVLLSNGTPIVQPGQIADGFYRHCGKLYFARGGLLLHELTDGSWYGLEFHCDPDGVCSVGTGFLVMAKGERYHMIDGAYDTRTGLVELDGAMYCLLDGGRLVCNADWNSLYFGADGRYTSGNEKIDAYVDQILASCTNSSMTQQQKLYALYSYVFYHMIYQSDVNHVAQGADPSTWCETYMLRLIERGRGNCYCYASEMYYFARRIGYWNAKAISGKVSGGGPNGRTDHGWLEIPINGVKTVTDPELESKLFPQPGNIFLKPYNKTPFPYYPPAA